MTEIFRQLSSLIDHSLNDPDNDPIHFEWNSSSARGGLCFFGSMHTTNPRHHQFESIRNTFRKFKPETVLIEGAKVFAKKLSLSEFEEQKTLIMSATEDALISRAGEILFVAQLAMENSCYLFSPEPSREDAVDFILKTKCATIEEILLYCFCVELLMWKRQPSDLRRSIEGYIDWVISDLEEDLRTSDLVSIEALVSSGARSILGAIDLKSLALENLEQLITPFGTLPLSRVAQKFSAYRDVSLFHSIYQFTKAKKRVFVCYGRTHLLRLKPAIDELFRLETRTSPMPGDCDGWNS